MFPLFSISIHSCPVSTPGASYIISVIIWPKTILGKQKDSVLKPITPISSVLCTIFSIQYTAKCFARYLIGVLQRFASICNRFSLFSLSFLLLWTCYRYCGRLHLSPTGCDNRIVERIAFFFFIFLLRELRFWFLIFGLSSLSQSLP